MSFLRLLKVLTAKPIRLNEEKSLYGKDLEAVLVSSMYAEQHMAYLNSYETGMPVEDLKALVNQHWGIYDYAGAMNILNSLISRNQDPNLEVVYRAYMSPEKDAEILENNLPKDQESQAYYIDIFRSLKTIIPELTELNYISGVEEVFNYKDAGWNLGRCAFLARCSWGLGYIKKEEMMQFCRGSYENLKKYCTTWEEYTKSYVLGRTLWGGNNNSGILSIAQDLLEKDESPLKNKQHL